MCNRFLALIFLAILVVSSLAESPAQTHDSILAAMVDLVAADFRQRGGNFEAETVPLDARLRLPLCDSPLQAFFPQGRHAGGFVTVGVRCTGSSPWTVYGKVRVKAYREVVVAKVPIRIGGLIGRGDVGLVRKDLSELGGDYLIDPAQAVGRVTRRMLAVGAVVGTADLRVPQLVRRGQKVIIRAESAGIAVTMSGEALADGSEGERIQVRNERSSKVVEGVIIGPGVVRVGR